MFLHFTFKSKQPDDQRAEQCPCKGHSNVPYPREDHRNGPCPREGHSNILGKALLVS